jgi:hypothetical protein
VPLFVTVTESPAAQDVLTVKAKEPVDAELTTTPALITNVTSVIPATYPVTFAVFAI